MRGTWGVCIGWGSTPARSARDGQPPARSSADHADGPPHESGKRSVSTVPEGEELLTLAGRGYGGLGSGRDDLERLGLDVQLHLVANQPAAGLQRHVPFEPEVLAANRALGGKGSQVSAVEVRGLALEGDIQGHFARHTT